MNTAIRIVNDKELIMDEILNVKESTIILCNYESDAKKLDMILREKNLRVLTMMGGSEVDELDDHFACLGYSERALGEYVKSVDRINLTDKDKRVIEALRSGTVLEDDIKEKYDESDKKKRYDTLRLIARNESDSVWWGQWNVVIYYGVWVGMTLTPDYSRVYGYYNSNGFDYEKVGRMLQSVNVRKEKVIYVDDSNIQPQSIKTMRELSALEKMDINSFLILTGLDRGEYLSLSDEMKAVMKITVIKKIKSKVNFKELLLSYL